MSEHSVTPITCKDGGMHIYNLKAGSETGSIHRCSKCGAYFIYDKYPGLAMASNEVVGPR